MATEIEIKAHVKDRDALRRALSDKAEYLCAFEKEDCYWILAKAKEGETRPPIRVRREKRDFPDETGKESVLVTCKIKERRDGMEINDEREFEVKPAQDFEQFLSLIGYAPGFVKGKKGWAFSRDGITAELAEVRGLGWFIELEILNDTCAAAQEEFPAGERKRLLDFLASLGIERDAIESRYYSEMLEELRAAGSSV